MVVVNRYYSNAYGRFMTPDPSSNSRGPSDPQSWNRYAYTRGDPVNFNDPSGTSFAIPDPVPPQDCDGYPVGFFGCGDGYGGFCEGFEDGDASSQSPGDGCGAPSGPCFGADGFTPNPGPFCQVGGGGGGGDRPAPASCNPPTGRYVYTCLTGTGSQVGQVQGDFQWLAEYIDPNCLQWLNLAAGNAYDYLTGLNVGVANLFSYVGGAVTYNVAACV